MLARSKLNSIETLTSKALIDLEITHEDCQTIISDEEKYRKMKENIRMMRKSKKWCWKRWIERRRQKK